MKQQSNAQPNLDLIQAALPIPGAPGARIFAIGNKDDTSDHFALFFPLNDEIPLVRIHSECATGDVLGSLRCDCGPQLEEAMKYLKQSGGFLIYLRQEGRGIGLREKIKAYALQEKGLDTYLANKTLGHAEDARTFEIAANFLKSQGIHAIRLITNNPRKIQAMEECGIKVVERKPTSIHMNPFNRKYLHAKAEKGSHLLSVSNQ